MSKGLGRAGWFSRRDFLKSGTMFGLLSSMHLEALQAPREGRESLEASACPADPSQPASPAWMKDLVIYEIATRGFTSPEGPESGTFASLKAKLPYLQDLGVTGIWLTGYSLCDPHHFYNIWTQYAVIEPDKFDPTLGTAEEFKSVVDDAHSRRIRVFLDVITHGLMKDSPVIRQHPSWFRGGSWGMTDFDWTGGHTELDDWWVNIYSDFVTKYGVDGFRLDVDIYRPDLWERIRRNAAASGHPIVIWEETSAPIRGVTDFSQHDNFVTKALDHQQLNEVIASDMPGFYDRKYGRGGKYEVEVHYRDSEVVKGSTNGEGQIGVHLVGLSEGRVGRRIGESAKPDGLPNVKITLDHIAQKPIDNIIVQNDADETWALQPGGWAIKPLFVDRLDSSPGIGPKLDLYVSTLSWGPSIQLSCHDNGWEGFPLDKNPYVAQGSRSLFGYSFLFSPMIPIFFSGEEFDATFHALPGLSPHLYGGEDAGRGRWLYGAMLDWNELKEPKHNDMFEDVQRMISIRKQNAALAMAPGGKEPKLRAVEHASDRKVPVPYLRWDGHSAILVAANRDREQDAEIQMTLNLAGTGIEGRERYRVTDLWAGSGTKTLAASALQSFECIVKRDGTRQGGLAVFRIEPA